MTLAAKEKLEIVGRCKECGCSVYRDWPHKCTPKRLGAKPKGRRREGGFLVVGGPSGGRVVR